ncbi:MAG: chloride channel protein [Myxococcales bacterium]|jgi:CIC family chloride channel protein
MRLQGLRDFLLPASRAQSVGRLLGLCAGIGVLVGGGAILFELALELTRYGLLGGLAGYQPDGSAGDRQIWGATTTPFRPWVLALLPAAGGLIGGLLIYWLAPEAEGHGTDAVIDAYHRRRGYIRGRVPIVKAVASAITLGSGGSAGREGPVAQIGAGISFSIAKLLRLSTREKRVLMVAGMAAGIGCMFRAPLAGALFAAEVLYKEMDLEFEVIVPGAFASIAAYSVFTMALGTTPLFSTTGYSFGDPLELIPYSFLAIVVAGGAKVYVSTFYWIHDRFKRMRIWAPYKQALGGAGVGLFAFFLPEVMGTSYGIVQHSLDGHLPLLLLAAIVIGKILTTSLTVGSGQSGGVFGPSIVIGAALGGLVGEISNQFIGWPAPPVAAFVIVGMAGFFAGAANTPMSTIIMVSEMVGNYHLLVPTLWVSTISFVLVRRSTLYRSQVARRADSPVHRDEMLSDVLKTITVQEALDDPGHEPTAIVHPDTSLRNLLRLFDETHRDALPVTDAESHLIGVIKDFDLRHVLAAETVDNALTARDLVRSAPLLTPTESLHSAMHKMVEANQDELVVVADDDPDQIVGTLSRGDLIAAYDHRIRSRSTLPPP